MTIRLAALAGLLLCFTPADAAPPTPDVAAIAAHYQAWLPLHPLEATELGLHDAKLDGALPELSPAADQALSAVLTRDKATLLAVRDARGCDEGCRFELELTVHHIDAELFELSTLRAHERYAGSAPSLVAGALLPIIRRDFAPLAERALLAERRLGAAPRVLEQALARLRTSAIVTRASVDIAREDLPATARFLERDVPAAFDALPDAALRKRVRDAGLRAATALRAFDAALGKEIAPRAQASFALGEPIFTQLIKQVERIDEPLPRLLARGQAELQRLQGELREVARRIDPKADPHALKTALGKDHPSADRLLAEVRARMGALRSFVVEKQLVTMGQEPLPTVEETPPFLRATTQASMDTPGPYEPRATEAFYHVTLPDPSWSKARADSYLGGAFNHALIDVVSIHEALPGHWVQGLATRRVRSQVRRMQGNGGYGEGWAHYCEEMVLEAGWGQGPQRDKLKIAQLSDALLRAARYVVAIRMHTGGMTLDEARRFFELEGFQSPEVALIEAKRGTEDALYFHYTWGKLELLALRETLRTRWGKDFTLRRFHDAILDAGPMPLPLLRRALLR